MSEDKVAYGKYPRGPVPSRVACVTDKKEITTGSLPDRQLLAQPPPSPLSKKQPEKYLALKARLDQQILAGVWRS